MEKVEKKAKKTNGALSSNSIQTEKVDSTNFTPASISVVEETPIAIEAPLISQGEGIEGVGEEAPSEEFTIEDCKYICTSLWNLPAMFWGDHLVLEAVKIDAFANQFYRYCIKKEINPYDYFFDEFPLAITAIGLGSELWRKHKEHKEGEKKDSREKSPKEKEEEDKAISNIEEVERKEGIK